ncbi:DUF6470 family protein [Robertmurraya korlensis]|uniref:DUF6470 family protein n=1 Tax=Robertmurraya korlensis TaxID=519977 RepID=UPI0008271C7B|nr:DUF6470 family protein [Robertmurraya korlensis]
MNVPQIRLSSLPAKIQIDTQQGAVSIEQPKGTLEIEQPKADMNITRIPGKLTIDQTQARADVDMKSVRKRNEEAAQLGKQELLSGIAKRVQDGEELMRIENGFGAISSISKRASEGPSKEFGLGFIPKAGSVKVSYDPGRVDVKFDPNKPKINYQANKPLISIQPTKVNVSIAQYASLEIDFE